ncbi:MAG: GntR family transcriptional regulator [Pseudomonadota bacterium]
MARPKTEQRDLSLQLEPQQLRGLDTHAADQLRRAILTGALQPGERITEEWMAATVGISRGTVRAALRLLVHEGLVVQQRYRGYTVRSLTAREAWELYTLRNTLEGFAARLLAEGMDDAKQERLDAAYALVVKAVRARSRKAAVEADFGLHQTIAELTGHSRLQAHYALIAGQRRLYHALEVKISRMDAYVDSHAALIDALRNGRAAEAETLAAHHNTEHGERLVRWLEDRESS